MYLATHKKENVYSRHVRQFVWEIMGIEKAFKATKMRIKYDPEISIL